MSSNDVLYTPLVNSIATDNDVTLSDHTTPTNSHRTSQEFKDAVVSLPENTDTCKPDGCSEAIGSSSETASPLDSLCSTTNPSSFEDTAVVSDGSDTDTASETESFVDALDNLHIESTDATFNSDESHDTSVPSSEPSQPVGFEWLNEGAAEKPYDPSEFDLCDDEKLSMNHEDSENITVIDEECIKAKEALLSDDEKQERRAECRRLKELGNERYKEADYDGADDLYTDALVACLLSHTEDRAVIYANRAAARIKQDKNEAAIEDCNKAVELNPDYLKALLRRAELYEKTDKLDEAFADYQKALERDPSLHQARAACMRLPDQIKERNEKMKDDMIGKLKDLGNLVLRPFGLSTNNFQLQQDPATGGYSVKFNQNGS